MFRFLQVVVAIVFFVGILALFGKKLKRSRAFITGLSIVLLLASICSGVVLNAVPMPTEQVRIEATGDSNSKSQGNIIGIKSVIVDGKEYPIEKPSEGTWYYSKNDAAYLWLNEGDERLKEPVTQEISIEIPVGAGRKLVFLTGEQFGIAKVSYRDESAAYDLYKEETAVKKVTVPDSNRVYDDFVKLCRLGGYSVLVVAALALALWLVKNVEQDNLIKLLCITLSVVTTLTFCLDLGLTSRSGKGLYALLYDFNRSFSGNFVLSIIFVPMLYRTFLYCGEIYRKNFCSVKGTLCITLPAGLFAAFMVIGEAFINGDNTLRPIFENELQVLKSLFGMTGYFAVFFFGITWIFNYLDCVDIYKISNKKQFKPAQMYLDNLNKRPFRTALITLIILYIPDMIASYPGIFMGDAKHHLSQVYGTYALNNAHPVMYTLFVGLCVKTGELLFGSVNAGVYVYSVAQFFFMTTTISLLIKLLTNLKISNKVILVLILYYGIHPRMQSYMCLMTKDIMNAAFLLIFMVSIYMLITQKRSTSIYALLTFSDLGAMLFRHDSQYVIVISLFILIFMIRDLRWQLTVITVCSLSFILFWNSILLPAANVLPTHPWYVSYINKGFLASIMVQQTARYIRDAGDEVTAEEKKIISTCFDYEKIVTKYQPDHQSDGAISTFRASTTREDWRNYQKIWFQMFFKHPEIYLEATLNHKYQFLYPRLLTTETYSYGYSSQCMEYINEHVPEMPTNIFYPECLQQFRAMYQGLRESFFKMPIFNLLFTSSSFFWILFTWLSYCTYKKNTNSIAIMMPLLILIFVLIAGPCNGRYFRYSFAYAFDLPILIVLGLHSMKQKAAERQKSITC